jgi:hypothetical protein
MDLNKWAADIHEIAKSKGWWDEPRDVDDIIALCHSELSEALEVYRDGADPRAWWWQRKGQRVTPGPTSPGDGCKPEGVPIELADCAIRIMDYAAYEGWRLHILELDEPAQGLSATICSVHSTLSLLWHNMVALWASQAIHEIKFYLASIGHDFEELVRVKCAFNRTRPHRHGGKVL